MGENLTPPPRRNAMCASVAQTLMSAADWAAPPEATTALVGQPARHNLNPSGGASRWYPASHHRLMTRGPFANNLDSRAPEPTWLPTARCKLTRSKSNIEGACAVSPFTHAAVQARTHRVSDLCLERRCVHTQNSARFSTGRRPARARRASLKMAPPRRSIRRVVHRIWPVRDLHHALRRCRRPRTPEPTLGAPPPPKCRKCRVMSRVGPFFCQPNVGKLPCWVKAHQTPTFVWRRGGDVATCREMSRLGRGIRMLCLFPGFWGFGPRVHKEDVREIQGAESRVSGLCRGFALISHKRALTRWLGPLPTALRMDAQTRGPLCSDFACPTLPKRATMHNNRCHIGAGLVGCT